MNVDKARLGGGDAVLESILDERDKDKGGDERPAVGRDIELGGHADVGGEPDAHEFDVIADEVHFFAEGDVGLLVVIQHVAEELAEFLHCLLRLVGVEGDEGVDVVERVEQEVGVELVAQVLQFGFRTASFGFLAGCLVLRPTGTHADGGAQSDGEDKAQHVSGEEQPAGRPSVPFGLGDDGRVEGQALPEVKQDAEYAQQDDVVRNVSFRLILKQVARNQKEIVDVEGDHKGEGHGGMTDVCQPVDIPVSPLDEEEREAEHNPPTDDMDQYLQRTAR